mmetsp:Transcript_65865/g.122922  ORF Transcript_65865/g.122922 Transcript_65865/m.122922 type:complete len:493 (+) Transcript_65865:110-1588(+)
MMQFLGETTFDIMIIVLMVVGFLVSNYVKTNARWQRFYLWWAKPTPQKKVLESADEVTTADAVRQGRQRKHRGRAGRRGTNETANKSTDDTAHNRTSGSQAHCVEQPEPIAVHEEDEWCKPMSLAQKKAARKARARTAKLEAEEQMEQPLLPMVKLQEKDQQQEVAPTLALESAPTHRSNSSSTGPSEMDAVCSFLQRSPVTDTSSPFSGSALQVSALSVKNTFIDVLEPPPPFVLKRSSSSPAVLCQSPEASFEEGSAEPDKLDMQAFADAHMSDTELPAFASEMDSPRPVVALDVHDDTTADETHTAKDGPWAKAARTWARSMYSGNHSGFRPPRSRVPVSNGKAGLLDGWVGQTDGKVWFEVKDIMLPCFDGLWIDELGEPISIVGADIFLLESKLRLVMCDWTRESFTVRNGTSTLTARLDASCYQVMWSDGATWTKISDEAMLCQPSNPADDRITCPSGQSILIPDPVHSFMKLSQQDMWAMSWVPN